MLLPPMDIPCIQGNLLRYKQATPNEQIANFCFRNEFIYIRYINIKR